MFERPQTGERAILVHLDLQLEQDREDLSEFQELAVSAGALPVGVSTGSRKVPEPKFFVGAGKAEEIRELAENLDAQLVLVNHALSPAQERNLERLLQRRVLDRTGLILDIFAQRARSHEGKLQVELAQLRHLSTRLVRGWTHLERQKGGIGLRGPGETQLETDRRLLGDRIKQLNKRLEKVQRQREQSRRARTRADVPTISLVGYTNAGKSTLFNTLTRGGAYAADQLFATLDPTMRRLKLPNEEMVVLADTVGFIRHLPHDLVAAFRSTLQETQEADLLLHVIDAADPERREKIEQVQEVLHEIGAGEVQTVEVFNKIDLLDEARARIEYDEGGRLLRAHLSSYSGEGLEAFLQALGEELCGRSERRLFHLAPADGRIRARLYELGTVLHEEVDEQGSWALEVELRPDVMRSFSRDKEMSVRLEAAESLSR